MDYKQLLLGAGAFTVAHILTFFQLNGQFLKIDWFRKNEWIVAVAGIVLSYFYIWGTKHTVAGFDGLLWPGRLVGFGSGMIVMAVLTWWMLGEGINLKTLTSLILATALVMVQVFWKA